MFYVDGGGCRRPVPVLVELEMVLLFLAEAMLVDCGAEIVVCLGSDNKELRDESIAAVPKGGILGCTTGAAG